MSKARNTDHFDEYELLPRSYQEDLVEDAYQIHIDRGVSELSNQFCRYYFATHIKSEKEYFAIVFERSFSPPVNEIDILKKHHSRHINKLHAYSLVKLSTSKKYQFVAIVDSYDPTQNLQNLVEQNGPLNTELVENSLLPALWQYIEFGDTYRINCCNINPKNIIVTKDNNFILKEFVTALPNFYQPQAYLSPEISDAIPSGRAVRGTDADMYASAMVVVFAISGTVISFPHRDTKIFNAERIEGGSYEIVSKNIKIPRGLRSFLSAALQDNPSYRLKVTGLKDLLSNTQSNIQNKSKKNSHSVSGHTILFEGHNYSHPEALASAAYAYYDAGLNMCHDENFVKWSQKAKGKTDNIAEILSITNHNRVFSKIVDAEKEETMLKIFSMLDDHSPIRLKDFCITIESISNILFSSIYTGNKILFDQLSKILRRGYWRIVLNNYQKDRIPFDELEKIQNLANVLTGNASEYIGKQELYRLDRYIPCLSPTVISDYVLSLGDLLVALDKIAAHTPSKLVIDEHIAAFIYSRLVREDALSATYEQDNEHFEKSVMLKGASLLALAQENSHDIKVPHLCSLLSQKIIEWVNDNLHSSKLKKVITSEIAELSATGSLSQVLYVISNPQLFQNDRRGYKVAYQQSLELTTVITDLSDEKKVYEMGVALGQRLTVLLSYFLLMLVTLMIMI